MAEGIYAKLTAALLVMPMAACVWEKGETTDEGESVSWNVGEGSKHLESFLALCKDYAELRTDKELMDGALTAETHGKYEIVFANAKYVSFRAEESVEGSFWAHGGKWVTVGTFDRKMGRRMNVADIIPEERRAETLAKLKSAVVAEVGGEEELQGEVTLTDNFYIAKDGLHFVFNEYEVACYAAGTIEAVVKCDLNL